MLSRVRSFPPIASDSVFQAVERFYRRVEGIREILTDVDVTSVRLVVNPEKMVVAEARRLLTYLSLFSYRVDAVIVNRVIPEDVVDPYFANWKQIQKTHLQGIEESFAPLPILRARLFDREVTGLGSLELLAREVYGKADPSHVVFTGEVLRVDNRGGERALSIRLPFADRGGVELARSGDELFIKVGNVKRNVAIPQSLKSKTVVRASLDADWLRVVFEDGTGGANGRIEG